MIPFVQDADFTLWHGDVLDVLAEMPAASVHCVVTSPPYWALRDYAIDPTDWPEVSYSPLPGFDLTIPAQTCCLGLEYDPYAFVGHLVAVFRELRRVVRPEATVWLNIGDSYATRGGGAPGDSIAADGYERRNRTKRGRARSLPGVKPKDMVGIPWLLAFALRTDGWWLRAENIWDKANPMPESTTDRPAKAHEQVFLLTRSERCFYDYVAVREAAGGGGPLGGRQIAALKGVSSRVGTLKAGDGDRTLARDLEVGRGGVWREENGYEPARRNLRSVWRVASQPYPGAHFAVFPPALIEPCILAGTSAKGCCSDCGAPWEPVNERRSLGRHELPADHPGYRPARYVGKHEDTNGGGQRYLDVVTVDWKPSCGCDAPPRPCTVLDPFMGAGTTAVVARKHGRHAVGIEKSPEYAHQIAERLAQQSLLASGPAGGVVEVVDERAAEFPDAGGQVGRGGGPVVDDVDDDALVLGSLEDDRPGGADRLEGADSAGGGIEVAHLLEQGGARVPREDDLSAAVADDDAFVAAELGHDGEPTAERAA